MTPSEIAAWCALAGAVLTAARVFFRTEQRVERCEEVARRLEEERLARAGLTARVDTLERDREHDRERHGTELRDMEARLGARFDLAAESVRSEVAALRRELEITGGLPRAPWTPGGRE